MRFRHVHTVVPAQGECLAAIVLAAFHGIHKRPRWLDPCSDLQFVLMRI
jgi:hypothetical protein